MTILTIQEYDNSFFNLNEPIKYPFYLKLYNLFCADIKYLITFIFTFLQSD